MAALGGLGFSPYIDDSSSGVKSGPERCLVTFFDREDIEGNLISFLPGQAIAAVQPAGAIANESIALGSVRLIRFTEPVDIRRSVEHFSKHGIMVHSVARKAPFSLTYRDGRVLTGELHGYGAEQEGFGVYLVDEEGGDDARGIRCYFPASSVENFTVGEKLGKLLLEKEDLTADGLRTALEEQQRLRTQKLGEILIEHRLVDMRQLEEAIKEQSAKPIRRLGEVLVESGMISDAQLREALEEQSRRRGRPLGEILVGMGLLDKDTVREVLAQKLGIPHVDLAKFRIEEDAFTTVPISLVLEHHVMPLYKTGGDIVVAMENPLDGNVIEALRFATQLKVIPVLASRDEIDRALRRRPSEGIAVWTLEGERVDVRQVSGITPESQAGPAFDPGVALAGELASRLEDEAAPGDLSLEASESTVRETDNTLVKLVNKIVLDARDQGASDIHIEPRPGKENTRIRFRRDGVLHDYLEVPASFRNALVARIKIMANLDISEKRRPQDGKIDFKRFGPARIELRVATIPTNNNLEGVVLRILASAKPMPLDRMQLAPRVLKNLRALAEKPYGLILVCGPTGSGKTTTLHSVLGYINTPERKIWTAEDPVEITQPGLSQVQVNAKIGWTFAAALRSFLRADPDVIMVGEMRDQETAQTSIEASLTGHLVLSTLHTNSAAESITRLLDMGLDPFNFADALLGVLAQRLARRLCPDCKATKPGDEAAVRALAEEYCSGTPLDPARAMESWAADYGRHGRVALAFPVGCKECGGSGFRGRIALHELLVVSPPVRHLVRTRAPVSEIVPAAQEDGMHTLKQDGIEKVLQGLTTIEQVRSVCA